MRFLLSFNGRTNRFPVRELARPSDAPPGREIEKNMCMLDEIRAKRDEIYAIARKHKAEKLWVFGSCARKEERPDSDVDLLVKFSPAVGFRDYDFMEQYFSKLLGRNVDIVSSSVLPSAPRFANRVCKEAVAI